MASSTGDNDAGSSAQEISFKLQSRDLPSRRLIGKGLSGIGYETLWKGERFVRKDFIGVPKHIFEKEVAVLVGLEDHKNIVKTYGWTVDKRSCSLVLEYMDDDLLSLLQKRTEIKQRPRSGSQSSTSTVEQPFGLPQALHIMLQIALGMKALHEQGIAHGNLKTKNILVTHMKDGDRDVKLVKVTDFGLDLTKRKSKSSVSRQVRKLDMVQWKAPEYIVHSNLSNDYDGTSSESDSELESESESEAALVPPVVNVGLTRVDVFKADVYSFGVTCSHILTGKDPYPNLNWKELVLEILSGLRPDLPAACEPLLRDLLKSCWDHDPAQRPTFSAIRMRLEHVHHLLMKDFLVEKTSIVPSFEPTLVSPVSQVFRVDLPSEESGIESWPETRVPRSKCRWESDSKSPSPPRRRDALKRLVTGVYQARTTSTVPLYRGVRYREELNKYVTEIRPTRCSKKIWLGTYDTAEEAARAFDIGNLCCKKNLPLNFPDSPKMLRKISSKLSPEEARSAIAKLAKEVARMYAVNASSNSETDTRKNVDRAAAIKPHDERHIYSDTYHDPFVPFVPREKGKAHEGIQQEAEEQEPVLELYTGHTSEKVRQMSTGRGASTRRDVQEHSIEQLAGVFDLEPVEPDAWILEDDQDSLPQSMGYSSLFEVPPRLNSLSPSCSPCHSSSPCRSSSCPPRLSLSLRLGL